MIAAAPFLALVLALVLAAAPAAGASEYRIVLDSGRILKVAEEPRRERGLVLATLADGTLVSLPEGRVDWEATRRVNAAAAPAARAARAARTARTERRARSRVITNRTIESFSETTPATATAPTTGAEASVTDLPGPARPGPDVEPRPVADDEGNGPAYWRERARVLRDRTRAAERELDAARRVLADEEDVLLHGRTVSSRTDPLRVVQYPSSREELAALLFRLSELREKVAAAEARVEEARQQEADLRVEAREVGADPGWLRLPVAYR